MHQTEQEFLKELDKKLWSAADKLRNNLDAAVYKHVVLGLIFLKYVSDAFEERRQELRENFRDPDHDYYIPQEDMSSEEYEAFIEEELYFDLNGEIHEPMMVAEFWDGGRQISLKANGNGFKKN